MLVLVFAGLAGVPLPADGGAGAVGGGDRLQASGDAGGGEVVDGDIEDQDAAVLHQP